MLSECKPLWLVQLIAFICILMMYVLCGEASTVDAVEGQNASLPCSVHLPIGDRPTLTLWYIGTKQTPIFSYDQRGNNGKGSGWADPMFFGDQRYPHGFRVHYDVTVDPPSLIIFDVQREDAKDYRCRVDFVKSTSEFAWIILKVVVPPKKINILIQVSPVAPKEKNDVVCQVSGGDPPASVVWLQKGQVVDANYNVTAGVSLNSLEKPASREDLSHYFTCSAQNNDVTPPIHETFLRNVTCGPLSMQVSSHPQVLSAGKTGELKCVVIGSNPPPIIKWFRHGKIMNTQNISVTHEENVTTSRLSFTLMREDHHSPVVCRAENAYLPLATLEDIITLEVTYSPFVRLQVGRPLLPTTNTVAEGSDVFLECTLDANPKVYKITWYKDNKALPQDNSLDVKSSESIFALSKVDREDSGRYQCSASNIEGDSFSNNVSLTITYAPICSHRTITREISLNSLENVTCIVDANPPPEGFSWTFDSSARKVNGKLNVKTIERSSSKQDWKYISEGNKSMIFYTARSSQDYGTFKCIGYNEVGRQKRPCIIKVIPLGEPHLPRRVTNCIVVNVTSHSAGITCQPDLIGATAEKFHVEVWKDGSNEIVYNKTLPNCAYFTVPKLLPSHLYSATITAFNQHGRASPLKFSIRTRRMLPEEKSLPSKAPPTHVGIALGVTFGVILVLVVVAFGVRWFLKRPRTDTLSIRTLSKKDSTKEKGNLLKGTTNPEESSINGVFEYTIYDSSGRYKGFSHLPPQTPGGRFPVPVAAGMSSEFATTSSNVQTNSTDKVESADIDRIEVSTWSASGTMGAQSNLAPNSSVKLKRNKGWAKLRGAFVFIRKSNYILDIKRRVLPKQLPDNNDQESKI